MRVRQHALRGFAGSAVDLLALEGVSAKIPMYLSRSARDRYVGHADADFTQRASDYWTFLTGGTVLDIAHLYWHSDTKTVQMHDARVGAAERLCVRAVSSVLPDTGVHAMQHRPRSI